MTETSLLNQLELEQAQLMAALSALAYRPETEIRAELKTHRLSLEYFFDDPVTGTQGFCAKGLDFACFAFRGTETSKFEDVIVDLLAFPVDYGSGKVHLGFRTAFKSIETEVLKHLKNFQALELPVYFTGHSLGGALAALAAAFALDQKVPIGGLFTFGQPRAGNDPFEKQYAPKLEGRHYRFTNGRDIVPHVPLYFMGYRHFGKISCHFTTDGVLQKASSGWKWYLLKTLAALVWAALRSSRIRNFFVQLFNQKSRDPAGLRPLARDAVKDFLEIFGRDIISFHSMQAYLANLNNLTSDEERKILETRNRPHPVES